MKEMRMRKITKIAVLALILIGASTITYAKWNGSGTNKSATSKVGGEVTSSSEDRLNEALGSHRITVLCFHSTTCQPCIEMDRTLNDVKPMFKNNVTFISVITNDPSEAAFTNKFGIDFIPTTYFFNKKGKVARKQVGVLQKEKIVELLKNLEGDNT